MSPQRVNETPSPNFELPDLKTLWQSPPIKELSTQISEMKAAITGIENKQEMSINILQEVKQHLQAIADHHQQQQLQQHQQQQQQQKQQQQRLLLQQPQPQLVPQHEEHPFCGQFQPIPFQSICDFGVSDIITS